jgi:hypothetical protein
VNSTWAGSSSNLPVNKRVPLRQIMVGGDAMRRVLLASGLAILGSLTSVQADDDRTIFAAYCVGYYKYTVQEMQRSLNESRQWAQQDAHRAPEDKEGWQKVIDSSQRELQGEMLGLDRSRNDLAQSLSTDGSNNMAFAILMAERRAQDDLRACFNEAAPGQDVPASCKRVRRCREADNILRAP